MCCKSTVESAALLMSSIPQTVPSQTIVDHGVIRTTMFVLNTGIMVKLIRNPSDVNGVAQHTRIGPSPYALLGL